MTQHGKHSFFGTVMNADPQTVLSIVNKIYCSQETQFFLPLIQFYHSNINVNVILFLHLTKSNEETNA